MASRANNPFAGKWRIVWMDQWDQDYVDMEEPGHITFDNRGSGSFHFGCVSGEIDARMKHERLEFSWSGFDEMDEIMGRGWVELSGRELHGHLYIHLGDDSAFRAVKTAQRERK